MIRYEFLVAGINMIFLFPEKIKVPDNFLPFLLTIPSYGESSPSTPEMVLEVTIQSSDFVADFFMNQPQKRRGQDNRYWYRVFMSEQTFTDFATYGHWLNFFRFEELLLPYKRIILHASAILYDGKAYLFVAPSGGGKSTQAKNWEDCYGSEILNGDKVILELGKDRILAHGSPVAGSSKIYKKKEAPLAGIFVIKKSDHNQLTPVKGFHKLLILYNAAVKSMQDDKINETLLDELRVIADRIPLYHFYCTKGRSAARELHRILFGD